MRSRQSKTARGPGVCVAADRAAALAGASVLNRGGNAFDAVAAAGFTESVISPSNCGIGGYGATGIAFHARTGNLIAIDANAVAPMAATPGMFPTTPTSDPNGYKLIGTKHKLGPLAVAVPGVLAGLLKLHEQGGRLTRQQVMEQAIAIAQTGPILTPALATQWLTLAAEAAGKPAPPKPTKTAALPMPRLAETLAAIAEQGPAIFYSGRIGRAIADHVRAAGGILTPDDMAAYQALVVEPVTVTIRGHTLATPPPGSGGLTSLQVAALCDRLARDGQSGKWGSSAAWHAFIETLKPAWVNRLTEHADPKWMKTPPREHLSDKFLNTLHEQVLTGLKHPEPGRLVAPDPLNGTVHLAAADAEGNVVAWTQTHGGGFGSRVMIPELEVVLGHGMCRFEPRPGWANSIAPGKRPLHNMCPVIALKEGKAMLAVGAAGGRTIVNNVAALVIASLIEELDPAAALQAPRLQCETLEPATIERSATDDVIESLRRLGHRITPAAKDAGSAHLIKREGNLWTAAAEPRSGTAGVAIAELDQ